MHHKILVAIDSSNNGLKVFDEALMLAQATGDQLMLLHVLSREAEASPNLSMFGLDYNAAIASELAEMYQKQWTNYERRGLEMLQSYARLASAAGITAEISQTLGHPGRTICTVARTCDAELIVIGRRGHSGLNELLLGSVSNYVVHHATCSVLIVQSFTHADVHTDTHTSAHADAIVAPDTQATVSL